MTTDLTVMSPTGIRSSTGGRELFWDVAKALAIFCVIWQHTVCNMSTEMSIGLSDPVSSIILPFHMPLFMFISGYFAFSSLRREPLTVMARKARQLLVPSIIWYLILTGLAILANRNLSVDRIKDVVTTLPSSYWFLKSLFSCYLITVTGVALYGWKKWSLMLFALLIIGMAEILNYVQTISMLPFFLFGLAFNRFRENLFGNPVLVFVGCVLIFIGIVAIWHTNDYNIYLHPFEFNLGG